jgi:hypothetical protein
MGEVMSKYYRPSIGIAAILFAVMGLSSHVVRYDAKAANIPLISGPNDPSQGQLTVNQLIQAINTGVYGTLNTQFTSSGNGADTTEDTLFTYTLPANTLSSAGKGLRIRCWGSTAANTDVKSFNLYFGASKFASATFTTSGANWVSQMEVLRNTTAATQQVFATGSSASTATAPYFNAGTDNAAAAVVIKCTGQSTTAAASDIVGQGFLVEILQ